MSALRQRLKNPRIYLCLLVAVLLLATVDSFRAPSSQLTARVYVSIDAVTYARYGTPLNAKKNTPVRHSGVPRANHGRCEFEFLS